MRLLDSKTLEFKEFFDGQVPTYAILSHRWEDEEVLFQDMKDGGFESKKGYPKLKGACDQAAKDGIQYIWIDTCCIDKSSSAELSEAINSMFVWYQSSSICYAYLSDVIYTAQEYPSVETAFKLSRWHSRGWTLQELIAPTEITFFDKDWVDMGTRAEWAPVLEQITGISSTRLTTHGGYRSSCVAQKMSWLAKRTTTRPEDMAYCMLGLFGVYMSPLYGEGQNAFQRLQLEILKVSDDESIFAWKADPKSALDQPMRGLLANAASEFTECGSIRQFDVKVIPPYSMTNKGLGITIELAPQTCNKFGLFSVAGYQAIVIYVMILACVGHKGKYAGRVGLLLRKHENSGNVSFSRVFPDHYYSHNKLNGQSKFLKKSCLSTVRYKGVEVTPSVQLIYVRSPDLLKFSHQKLGTYRSIQFLGKNLQSRLSEIVAGDKSNYWTEYEPFHFLQHTTSRSRPTAVVFTCENREGLEVNYIIVLFFRDYISLTKILIASHRTFWNSHSLSNMLQNAMGGAEAAEAPLYDQLPSAWLRHGWSVFIPVWDQVLRLEISYEGGYALSLEDVKEKEP